jgi:RNA polymerase sigma factor (sigma-70 family)
MGNSVKHTDAEVIIEGCKKNDSSMQTKLYYSYYSVLYTTIARYIADDDDRKDVVQETFIKVFDNITKLKDNNVLIPWMNRIGINLCMDKLRKDKKVNLSFDLYAANKNLEQENDDDSDEYYAEGISIDDVHEVLDQLPNGFKTVFMLYAVENYSHKEIAQMIGTSESNSKTQYMRAKLAIKNLVKQKLECKGMRS